MDTIADYLETLGVVITRTPNTKVPIDKLLELDRHFGYVPKPDDRYSELLESTNVVEPQPIPIVSHQKEEESVEDFRLGYAEASEDVVILTDALRKSQRKLIKLAEEGRVGSYSEPYIKDNIRILSQLTLIGIEKEQERMQVKSFLESLSLELFNLIDEYRNHHKHKNAYLMKADFIIKLRNRYLMAIDKLVVDEVSDSIIVGWDKVRFGNGKLYLEIGKEKPLICPEPRSKETYNLFQAAFVERVKPITVRIHTKLPPEIVDSPEFQEVFQFLEIREDIRLGSFSRRIDLANFIKSSKVNFQEYLLPKDRGPYLQYLVENQSPNHRFIPVFEKDLLNEDAFLFTLKGKRMYIIWENINEDTATYAFPVTESNYDLILQAIYDYASSDVDYKRMRMHYGEARKAIGVECRILYHNDLYQWKREVLSLIR